MDWNSPDRLLYWGCPLELHSNKNAMSRCGGECTVEYNYGRLRSLGNFPTQNSVGWLEKVKIWLHETWYDSHLFFDNLLEIAKKWNFCFRVPCPLDKEEFKRHNFVPWGLCLGMGDAKDIPTAAAMSSRYVGSKQGIFYGRANYIHEMSCGKVGSHLYNRMCCAGKHDSVQHSVHITLERRSSGREAGVGVGR